MNKKQERILAELKSGPKTRNAVMSAVRGNVSGNTMRQLANAGLVTRGSGPSVDMGDVILWALTPEGVEYVEKRVLGRIEPKIEEAPSR